MTRLRDLKELALDALLKREEELEDEIIRLRLRRATGQLSNPMARRSARRSLARVKTLIRQRRVEEGR
jgi:large subunit ribosomal protein L29